jgi:5,10-methylenetetrahydrofolate reductase
MSTASRFSVPIIAGLIVLKSGDMARHLNAGQLGIAVPDALIDEMDRAEDPESTGVAIATRTIKDLMSLCQGVHLVSVGREYQISSVLKAAGIASDSSLRER